MRAVLRLTIALFAGGLWLGPASALAQSTAQPATNTPAPDSIGPRELQNFNLNGTVTRPAETPPPARTQPRQPAPAATTTRPPTPAASSRDSTEPAQRSAPPPAATRPPPAPANPAGQSLVGDLAAAAPSTTATATQPDVAPPTDAAPTALAAEPKLLLWPWLLLAAVIAGAAFLLWRRRSREAFAGAPLVAAYVAPEPAQAPVPAPVPAPPAKPSGPSGVVSSRLRPWIEIAFVPLGCTVDDERVTIEFEVHLQNSGSALAREVVVEASLFNAGATQEQDIARFFAQPIGQGERIEALPPLQSVTIRTALVAPRANIQMFELGGQQVFVPLIAFNALYRAGSGRGQTSVAYMLGREATGDKLGPLRLDLGARAFTKLDSRALPVNIRA